MPCVCKGLCADADRTRVTQPYREGLVWCAKCKFFQKKNLKNRCYCCNGILRNRQRNQAPEKRKNKII